jgi:hypothetical protein
LLELLTFVHVLPVVQSTTGSGVGVLTIRQTLFVQLPPLQHLSVEPHLCPIATHDMGGVGVLVGVSVGVSVGVGLVVIVGVSVGVGVGVDDALQPHIPTASWYFVHPEGQVNDPQAETGTSQFAALSLISCCCRTRITPAPSPAISKTPAMIPVIKPFDFFFGMLLDGAVISS